MATIAFNSSQSLQQTTGSATLTLTHSASAASDDIGFCMTIFDTAGPQTLTGITWGGSAATFAFGYTDGGGFRCEFWYIKNPPSGSQSVVFSWSSSATSDRSVFSHDYTGWKTSTTPPDQTNAVNSNTSPITSTIASVSANSWVIGLGWSQGFGTVTASTGLTLRQSAISYAKSFDTNGIVSGSPTLQETFTSGGSWTLATMSFVGNAAVVAAKATFLLKMI